VLYTQYSTSNVGNQHSESIPIEFNPHPCQSLSMMNWNSKNLRNPHSKIDNQCCACKLLYLVHWTGYEGTDKETSWILTSELRHASELLQISTLHIQPSLVLCQVFDLGKFYFNLKSYFEVFILFSSQSISIYYSTFS